MPHPMRRLRSMVMDSEFAIAPPALPVDGLDAARGTARTDPARTEPDAGLVELPFRGRGEPLSCGHREG